MGALERSLDHEVAREFVALPDEFKAQIVYKWPDHEIRRFSKAIVDIDEEAVFVKQGRLIGTLPPGRHTLDADELPFLGALVDHFSGGRAYEVELYFIGTREYVGQTFGGLVDQIRDPDTGLAVQLKVFGDYGLVVADPVKLITRLTGTVNLADPETVTGWISDQVLKGLRQWLVTEIAARSWPVLGLAAHVSAIEAATVAAANGPLAEYGIAVSRLGNVVVSLSDQDTEALRKLTEAVVYSRLAGSFSTYAQGQALLGAGEGMSKGGSGVPLVAAGLGIGAGLASGVGAALASAPGSGMAASPAPAAFCGHCGRPFSADQNFCPGCGQARGQV